MRQVVIENPVLNSPFAEPTRHFRFSDDGITDLALSPYALFAASYSEGLYRSQDGGALRCRL